MIYEIKVILDALDKVFTFQKRTGLTIEQDEILNKIELVLFGLLDVFEIG